jgi:hypothetical protein
MRNPRLRLARKGESAINDVRRSLYTEVPGDFMKMKYQYQD